MKMKLILKTRLILIFGNYVIKIPVNKAGYLQNQNETYLYNKYKNLGMLGKLYWTFCGIVCMKNYNPVYKILKSYIKGIKIVIPELDIKNCSLHNSNNWGTENGYIVLIDYGAAKIN